MEKFTPVAITLANQEKFPHFVSSVMPFARQITVLFIAAGAMVVGDAGWGAVAFAQSIGGGGQVPGGSNLTSGLGFGNAGFGRSSTGAGQGTFGSGLGQGGFGQGGFGQGGFGQTGFGGQGGFGQSTSGFIGRDSAEVTAMFESMGRQAQQTTNRTQRATNRNRDNQAGGNEQTRQQVRVQVKLGFVPPSPASSPITSQFSERIAKLLAERQVDNLRIEREGGEVTVAGIAADPFERKLVEQLLSQQPGITSVTNRMTVAPATAAPIPLE